MNIHELQDLLCNGNNPYIDISNLDKVLLHYIEEVGELIKAIRKEPDKIGRELGDNLIMLCFVAGALHLDLQKETLNKIDINIKAGKFNFQLPDKHSDSFCER